ncbi:unnamed protein product [Urochloa humidicola]
MPLIPGCMTARVKLNGYQQANNNFKLLSSRKMLKRKLFCSLRILISRNLRAAGYDDPLVHSLCCFAPTSR